MVRRLARISKCGCASKNETRLKFQKFLLNMRYLNVWVNSFKKQAVDLVTELGYLQRLRVWSLPSEVALARPAA